MREFFAYRIQMRNSGSGILHSSRKLFQQFLVDAYSMVESSRLLYVKNNQAQLRADMYKGIEERILQGDTDARTTGTRIILPGSFTGGPRYMYNNFVDACQICNWIGFPTLFITITCNPNWPEIQRALQASRLRPEDRPDILCRVFKMKLDNIIKNFKQGNMFGKARAYVCTIEFQKRGLPHAHILLWLHTEDKPKTSEDIDKIICAEIPCKQTDRSMYKLVKKHMMHGPCGKSNLNSPCMKKGTCSKRFPKRYIDSTMSDSDGYPLYRRRKNDRIVIKKKIPLDNSYVVPYNRRLLTTYKAHINVELCNQNKSIKYLFKYVNKGHDRVTAAFYQSQRPGASKKSKDEVQMYYDCRYLSACEAAWRLFSFDIHYRDPPVFRLKFHLPDSQSVVFRDDQPLKDVLDKPSAQHTMFMAWFEANKKYPDARVLKYVEFPQKFVFKDDSYSWEPRKQGFSIGRIMNVPPKKGEDYYLRLLLNIQKGCTCYEDIRTVNNVVYPTFKDACYKLGLLDDDKEYIDAITEASNWATGSYIRQLFVILLICDCLDRPEHVWESCWTHISEDILYKHRKLHNNPGLSLSDQSLKNFALLEIEKLLQSNGSSLNNFECMPKPTGSCPEHGNNRYVLEELAYDQYEMGTELSKYMSTINYEQKQVFDAIMEAIKSNKGGMFFIYGHGGTGKTFLWKTLSAAVRSRGEIVINAASSGIASLLLPGGKTAHSRFGVPINIDESSTCNIKQQSPKAELLIKSKLIIWDEAPMMHRYCFEALDKTLKSILQTNLPFGGKVVVLGGDFRQILPVIPRGSRGNIVDATINSSFLWSHCTVLHLQKNMRLQSSSPDTQCNKDFADWILKIGNGEIGEEIDGESYIQIPPDLLIQDSIDGIQNLVNFVYPDLLSHLSTPEFFQDRAILAPTNDSVQYINDLLMSFIPGETVEYFSSDSICPTEASCDEASAIYSTEFLNNISCSGLPSHSLTLKVGVPVMLIRNIDQANGLCNGTRLQIVRMAPHVLNCKILSGKHADNHVFIPRMTLIPSNSTLAIKFQRRQFPIIVSFAMTINKSQGQTLSHVGLFLPKKVFTHGQLYVALSRVTDRKGIKILLKPEEGHAPNVTANVVYKEVFNNI